MQVSTGYCKTCKRQSRIDRPSANHILHLLLTLVTVGMWLPIWFLSSISIGGWRCSMCGRKVRRSFFG